MKGSKRTDDASHCEMSEKAINQSTAANTVKAQVLKGLMGEVEDWSSVTGVGVSEESTGDVIGQSTTQLQRRLQDLDIAIPWDNYQGGV